MEGAPRKHVVQEFEEFDYSNFYDDISVSTVTAGPNVTEYEVREQEEWAQNYVFVFTSSCWSLSVFAG